MEPAANEAAETPLRKAVQMVDEQRARDDAAGKVALVLAVVFALATQVGRLVGLIWLGQSIAATALADPGATTAFWFWTTVELFAFATL